MPRKLNIVVESISSLLRSREPQMLLWREIKAELWPQHKGRYKDEKSFSAGLSNYLTRYDGRLWKKEGSYWGTPQSSPPQSASLWTRLTHSFEQVGGHLVEISMKKASLKGRNSETGWREYNYTMAAPIEGIIIFRNSHELVATARLFGVYLKDEYDGMVLTLGRVEWPDNLCWKDNMYEVVDAEERLDGYDFGFRIGKLVRPIPRRNKETRVSEESKQVADEARSQVKTFLSSNLENCGITCDDSFTQASIRVIYTNPNYSIVKEFTALTDPIDGIYGVGIPETLPMIDGVTQAAYAFHERVPVHIYAVDKADVSGARLQWRMETELKQVCQNSLIDGLYRCRLERCNDAVKRWGSLVFYLTNFVLDYRRDVPASTRL